MKEQIQKKMETKLSGMKGDLEYIQGVSTGLISSLDTVRYLMSLVKEDESNLS